MDARRGEGSTDTDNKPSAAERRWRWTARRVLAGALGAVVFIVGLTAGGAWLPLDGLPVADRRSVAIVAGAGLAVLLLRGLALWLLLRALVPTVSAWRTLAAYPVTTLVSMVVPGGRAGGAPLNGLVVARATSARYEDGVATSLVFGVLTNLAVLVAGAVGVIALVTTTGGVGGVSDVLVRAGMVVGLVVVLTTIAIVAVRRGRGRLREQAVTTGVVLGRIARFVPGVTPPDRATLDQGWSEWATALRRFRARPRVLALPAVSVMGAHALTVVALWVALAAVGAAVPVVFLMMILPVAVLAAVLPAPGGVGGVEASLAALISVGSAVTAADSVASVVLYRAGTVLPALVCGVAAIVVLFARDTRRETQREG